jgi:hypothetical protein
MLVNSLKITHLEVLVARPRKSIEQLALSGTLKNNKGRYKKQIAEATPSAVIALTVPTPATVPDPPGKLTKIEREIWDELAPTLSLTSPADLLQLSIACKLARKMRSNQANSNEMGQLNNILDKLRPKVTASVATPKPVSLPIELQPKMSKAQYLELEGDLADASHVELFFDNFTDEAREAFLRRHPDFDRDDETTHSIVASRIAAHLALYDRTKLR